MSIIKSDYWLNHMYDENNLFRNKNKLPPFQRLMNHFPSWEMEDIFQLLLHNGLLPPSKYAKRRLESWRQCEPYKGLSSLLNVLKTELEGPSIDVFSFPLNSENKFLMTKMNGKNGLSFPTVILLFFHETVRLNEKKALLIHEYHHTCRLHYQKVDEQTVTLLESIVMEGLAEIEVKRRLGEKCVSPWMELYDTDFLLSWWERTLENKRNLKGRKSHIRYLYGGVYGIPRWLGYSVGYKMVSSYIETCKNEGKDHSSIGLLKTSAEDIYMKSLFCKK